LGCDGEGFDGMTRLVTILLAWTMRKILTRESLVLGSSEVKRPVLIKLAPGKQTDLDRLGSMQLGFYCTSCPLGACLLAATHPYPEQ
jgi:hypothetical protein